MLQALQHLHQFYRSNQSDLLTIPKNKANGLLLMDLEVSTIINYEL